MKRMLIGFVVAGTFSMPSLANDAKTHVDIFGNWRVVAALDSADVTALDDKEANKLVGKTVKISRSAFEFDGQVCKTPTYHRTSKNAQTYFRQQMNASTENLHVPHIIIVIDARCTYLYPKQNGKLMFFWHGFFFDAARVSREQRAPSN